MSQQLESDMDDHDNTNAPTCPSCGVPYGDHLGLHGTCAEVQQLRAQVEHLTTNATAREGVMKREGDLLRAALAQARATNAKLHRRTQAAEATIADTLREAARQVAAADERARAAESLTATVRRARAFIAAKHAEVDAVAAALAGVDSLRAALADVDHIDAMARRAEAVRCGIDDPDDTPSCLADFADEIIRLRAALADSQLVCGAARERAEDMSLALRDLDHLADLHRNLNQRTAEALGLGTVRVDSETGRRYLPSWHDMPERVAALRAALAEVLGWMPTNREAWVDPARVAEIRRLVDGER